MVSEILASLFTVRKCVPQVSVFCNKAFMSAYIPMLDGSIVDELIKRMEIIHLQLAACSVC